MRLRTTFTSALIAILLLPATPAAAGDPYAADPLGLVPFMDTTQQVYSTGTDVWEVWTCRVPGWTPVVSLAQVVDELNNTIGPYFEWLSNGRYSPQFVAGGTVQSTDVIPATFQSPEPLFAPDCQAEVAAATAGGTNGAVIVVDAGFDEGYAQSGGVCPEDPFTGCTTIFPSNGRSIVVGAATVVTVAPFTEPQLITVAHEIGHALNWPHTFGGLNNDPSTGAIDRYDNPMDVMSGAVHTGDPIGTIAYFRYAAGWIDPSQVSILTEETADYLLETVGGSGLQMVIIPTGDPGRFYALGARRRTQADGNLPKAGVEIYEIDQRRDVACALPSQWPDTWPCFATLVRVSQTPATTGQEGIDHVLSIDDRVELDKHVVEVVAANVDSFTVRVSLNDPGRFVDDDGNQFEAEIEAIATAGITNGCNPPTNDRFCPGQDVTRAEMAAFLIRGLGLEGSLSSYQGFFPDVPQGSWFAPYVELLFEIGITTGYTDGTYRPQATVTRAEMAAFLVRAFDDPATLPPAGQLFTDIPAGAWYIESAERLYALSITRGCSATPLRYCPDEPVRRDQMAAFLARALDL